MLILRAHALALVMLISPLCSAGVGVMPLPAPRSAEFLSPRIDSVFRAVIAADAPGCSVAVMRDGVVLFERGYGMANLDTGEKMRPETVLGLGSMSKQFTAAALAVLVRQGVLTLDADISRFLPELPKYGPITVANLLHHTSGIRDYTALWSRAGLDVEGAMSRDEAMGILTRQQGLTARPGTEELYSNSNYLLLSMIVERVSGKPFPEAVRSLVFEPLGMQTARFLDGPGTIVPGRAPSYRQTRQTGTMPQLVTLGNPLWGDGGMYASVRDLARWEANFVTPRLAGGQPFIDLMLSRGRLLNGDSIPYAFGLRHLKYRGQPTIEHGGTWGGYRSYYLRLPRSQSAVAVLCNRFEISPFVLSHQVADLAFPDTFTDPAPTLTGPDPAPARVAEVIPRRDEYVGRYQSSELDLELQIARDDRQGLVVMRRMAPGEPLHRVADDTLEDASTRWAFERDGAGRVTGFTFVGGRVNGVRFQRIAVPAIRIRRGRHIVVDGVLRPGEWADADSIGFRSGGKQVFIRYKHDGASLLFAYTGLGMEPTRVAEVLLDATGSLPARWSAQQFWVHVSARNCWTAGRYNDYVGCAAAPVEGNNIRGNTFPQAIEIRVPVSMIGGALTTGRRIGLAFDATDTRAIWDFWPTSARLDTPASWALAEIVQ